MSDKKEISRSWRFCRAVSFPKEEVLLQRVQDMRIILNQPVQFLKIVCLICSDSTFLLSNKYINIMEVYKYISHQSN